MKKKNNISKALLEVWEWKESAYKEVKGFDLTSAIRKRIMDSISTTHHLGFKSIKKRDRTFSSVF